MFEVDELFELTETSGGGDGGEGVDERVFESVDGEKTAGGGVGADNEEFK